MTGIPSSIAGRARDPARVSRVMHARPRRFNSRPVCTAENAEQTTLLPSSNLYSAGHRLDMTANLLCSWCPSSLLLLSLYQLHLHTPLNKRPVEATCEHLHSTALYLGHFSALVQQATEFRMACTVAFCPALSTQCQAARSRLVARARPSDSKQNQASASRRVTSSAAATGSLAVRAFS